MFSIFLWRNKTKYNVQSKITEFRKLEYSVYIILTHIVEKNLQTKYNKIKLM